MFYMQLTNRKTAEHFTVRVVKFCSMGNHIVQLEFKMSRQQRITLSICYLSAGASMNTSLCAGYSLSHTHSHKYVQHEKVGMLSVESRQLVADADVAHALYCVQNPFKSANRNEQTQASHKCTKNGFQSMLSQIENTIPLCTIVFQFSAICFAYLWNCPHIGWKTFTIAT